MREIGDFAKELFAILILFLVVYLYQTVINCENRIVKLEQEITELQFQNIELKKELSRAKFRKVIWDAAE